MKTVAVYMFDESNEFRHLVGYFDQKAGESVEAFILRVGAESGRNPEHLTTI